MKFSIGALLVLILVSALGMLASKAHVGISDERAKIVDLENMVASQNDGYLVAKYRIELAEQYQAANHSYDLFSEAKQRFKNLQEKYGALKLSDETKVAIVSVPTIRELDFDSRLYAFRVHVPVGAEIEVVGQVVSRDGKVINPGYFQPSDSAVKLPVGENLVEIGFQKPTSGSIALPPTLSVPDVERITVSINGNPGFQTTYTPVERGLSPAITEYRETKAFVDRNPIARLIRFTHFKNRRNESALQILIRRSEN